MILDTKQEILEVLEMPWQDFWQDLAPRARQTHREVNGDKLTLTSMMGYSNVCKNHCLYCGMRAPNTQVPRYRIPAQDVLASIELAAQAGFRRVFLISGEDPGYGFENLLDIVAGARQRGMQWISLACGEYSRQQYGELKAAGADEYVIKFEMSQPAVFDRLNPSTSFDRRMAVIADVQAAGMALASGNIVGWPGQTVEQAAEDILLIQSLGVSWAPIVPYLPAKNTPLAQEGGPGDLQRNLKELAILRLSMPHIRITGGQPGKNLSDGFSSVDGTQNALAVGADLLFADLLPAARQKAFRVVDDRNLLGLDHARQMAALSGMTLCLE